MLLLLTLALVGAHPLHLPPERRLADSLLDVHGVRLLELLADPPHHLEGVADAV
jgi:hypothetical protein